jgi:hypothetical protein
MGIPESQLQTWAKQGSITGSSTTYNTVKDALEVRVPYSGKRYSVYLQGSYGNATNIYAESDVDVVICLHDCFQSDRSQLSPEQETEWKHAHPRSAAYGHVEFKADVVKVLKDKFGQGVEPGNKAVFIPGSASRRNADVIVAIDFKRYFKFNSLNDQSFAQGICFYDGSNRRIANYPKQHRENLTNRHQDSGEWLKPLIRVMKNARTRLVADGVIKAGVAPSYYLEGLVYNAPLDCFGTNYGTSFHRVLQWMYDTADTAKWVTANEQYYLLWDDTPTSWSKTNYATFKNAVIKLWNDW